MNKEMFFGVIKPSTMSLCWGIGCLAVLSALLPLAMKAEPSNKPSPAWELKDVDGKAVKSSDFKGKVVILDFWATWCPPCRKEIPGFIELQDQYGKEGLKVVGISLDEKGPGIVKSFMKTNKMNYPVVMGNDSVTKDFGGIEGIPTTFIIDREGKIVGKHVGYVTKSVFEKEIKPLLKVGK